MNGDVDIWERGAWSKSLPYGQDTGSFPEYKSEPFIQETQTIGDEGSKSVEECSGWRKAVFGSDCKFDLLGGITGDIISPVSGAAVKAISPWLSTGVLFLIGAIFLVAGLFGMFKGGAINGPG